MSGSLVVVANRGGVCSAGEVREASRGKIILAPSNSAMQLTFLRAGLYQAEHAVPSASIALFRRLVLSWLIVDPVSGVRSFRRWWDGVRVGRCAGLTFSCATACSRCLWQWAATPSLSRVT